MPSATCQFDRGGAFPAYRNIGNINENIVDAHSKYSEHYRIGEESRLKKIGGKLLKEIVNRKGKEFGGRYPSSGSVTKLVDLIIDCNINFFSTRLSPTEDGDERELVHGILEGGFRFQLLPTSEVVVIDNFPVTVKALQSFRSKSILETSALKALMLLMQKRDNDLCEAHSSVNAEKKSYQERSHCAYFSAETSTAICVSSNEAELTKNKLISDIIQNDRMLGKYKSFFPYYWSEMAEWILIIIDRSKSSIRVCYSNFSPVDTSRIESTQKQSKLIEKKFRIFLGKVFSQCESPPAWKFSIQPPSPIPCDITHQTESGLFVAYALECEYFDCPMYATAEDWSFIRNNFVYWILKKQMPL